MTDGDHRRVSDYTMQPCPWPDGMEVEYGEPREDGTYPYFEIRGHTPVGEVMWRKDGTVLCMTVREDGEEAFFAADASMVRDCIAKMRERA